MTGPCNPPEATPDDYFEKMWRTGDDPWDHDGRFYEHRKYALTAASLRRARYGSVFEPGCATGILTTMLAPRAERYLATDRHPRAVEVARARLAPVEGVTVEQARIPEDWPDIRFDLIVLSEFLYYLEPADVVDALDRAAQSVEREAELVAVHYRQPVPEHALLGDEVHRIIASHAAWTRQIRHEEADFLLEGFTRR